MLGDTVLGERAEQRVFDASPLISLGTEQQRRRRNRALLNSRAKLGGRQNASRMALTTLRATSLLRRSIAVPLSSKYALGSVEIS